ncbi:MAG: glycosyltransferase family 2 protein [Candidatus Altiarchaeota archaeon]
MTLTYVVLTWNRKEDLRDNLRSVQKQTVQPNEIIVVDNNSTNGTIEMLEEEFPSAKLVRLPKNLGIAGWNEGMKIAKGDFLVLSDSDTVFPKDVFEKIVREFEAEPDLGIVTASVLKYDTKKPDSWVHDVREEDYGDKTFYTNSFHGCGVGIRKKAAEEAGYFSSKYFIYHNEFELAAKIINKGYRIRYCPKMLVYHKESQISRNKRRNVYYICRNWFWYVWTYYPMRLIPKHTVNHIIYTVIICLKYLTPLTILKVAVDCFTAIPRIMKERNPIKDEKIVRGKYWLTFKKMRMNLGLT